ncbi:MAG: alpha/beta hydrolase, partial [Burkholderiales bacterium]|nr:alpha/beta hydrolase [Opitutaceae bacterium]
MNPHRFLPLRAFAALATFAALFVVQALAAALPTPPAPAVAYRTAQIEGLDIFYREAGPIDAPTILLLHGFPTSSHMFRDLIPQLAERYHVIAPDYPGFGQSSAPTPEAFTYTFERLTDVVEALTIQLKLDSYTLYVQDYGAPVGFRLALRHPEKVRALVTQNGNAYEEGLTPFWDVLRNAYWKNPTPENEKPVAAILAPEGTRFQYLTGARRPELIAPDAWVVPQAGLDRPGNAAIQLALFYDYRTNPPLYDRWHAYFRQHQPPTLVVWGRHDPIFGPEGAVAFLRDLKHAELHLLDTGHFALEE